MADTHKQIMDVLFTAYIQNDFDGCKALSPSETDDPDDAIEQILTAANVTEDKRREVFNYISDEVYVAEKKGFENGVALGARLIINLLNGGGKVICAIKAAKRALRHRSPLLS